MCAYHTAKLVEEPGCTTTMLKLSVNWETIVGEKLSSTFMCNCQPAKNANEYNEHREPLLHDFHFDYTRTTISYLT